jgi:hypothetical protein
LGPDGAALPFKNEQELLDFLRNARVIAKKELSSGKNRPLKVRLEKDGIQANAVFRTVDKEQSRTRIDGKYYREYRDDYIHECAAYELNRILGINRVPPCVLRRLHNRDGSLQIWVENATSATDAIEQDLPLLGTAHWSCQTQMMRVFDALIYNFDRNLGNMLIDTHDKLWFIDHTRSFLVSDKIEGLEAIVWCDRKMWEGLMALDKEMLIELLDSYLDLRRILNILERRDKIVAHIQKLIEMRGENAVLINTGTGKAAAVSGN